jgi:DNA-binding LacI/PurR family transcriptional regulator
MARRGVDGVVLEGCVVSPALGKRLEALRAAGVAVVLQNMDMPDGKFDRVTIEMPRNSAKVVRHLIELGHRRIALIRRPDDRWRLEGYRAALAEFGIAFDERLVLDFTPETDPPSWARERLLSLKNRPTAVFAMSDRLAGEIVLDLLEAGWRVPGDVSVAAINDLWYTPALRVPLTTLRVPVKRIGRECGRLLLERIKQPGKPFEEVEIEGELVVRESTAAPAC